jgi:tetratricopeptide (TPR) repeat protein
MHLSTSLALAIAVMAGQDVTNVTTVTDVRKLYDAGRYQEVIRASDLTNGEAANASALQYLAAQSYTKLKDTDGARRTYQRLADTGANAWAPIGKSALQVLDKQLDEALASVDKAVLLTAALPEAHYQRGIVFMFRKEYAGALDAFTKATELDPTFAAAYYYAGLAASRIKRLDLTANNFGMFVKLAPNAPERPEVESILRTVRGR